MSLPSPTTLRSYAGAAIPTYLTATLAATYTAGQTLTVAAVTTWLELDANGVATANPIGTSGPFVIKVDFGLASEETILCSSANTTTGVITVWTDGTLNGRGYDGTPIVAHAAGTSANPNCFPTLSATETLQFNQGIQTAQTTANTALANAATAQGTANAALPKAGGTMTGAINMGTNKITSVTPGTVSTDAATFGQIPTSLPPSGSAGGDLTGSYPSPSLAAVGTAATTGAASSVPVITTDGKGRVTAATATSIQITESQVTNLTTDLAAKAATTTTISTTAPLAGGGDLSANRTLSIADATTAVKGAVQLTDSTSSTSTTTASTPNSVKTAYDLAAAALPKSGGTMTGAIAMGSNRVTGLPLPGASTDPLAASQAPGLINPSVHSNTYPIKAWNADPANCPVFTSQTAAMSTGIHNFVALSIPYTMTLNQIWIYQTTGAAFQATGGYYAFGIYDTSGNLLASTGNMAASGFAGLTGPLGWPLSAAYTIQPGNYMIGFLFYTGTGAGTPTTPVFGKPATANAAQINSNCPTPSSGKLDQRACNAGTGRTSLYSPMNVTPTASIANYWVAVA